MGLKDNKSAWRRLDNTAKIFPVIANEDLSNVFRLSVTLKKIINPVLLQQALEDVIPLLDHFRVKLRRGVFWYYFEENKKIPQVQRESTYPCRYIDPHGNRKFLFRVTYYQKRINLEVFHALTDGLGASVFLKELTYRYIQLEQEEVRPLVKREHTETEDEDSYLKNYRPIEHQHYSSAEAYRLSGNYLSLGSGQVLHGYVKVGELKAVCKRYGVSITKYLAASLIWSVWQEYCDGKAEIRPVVLNLPINLRSFFSSDTMANFFAVTMIGYLFKDPSMSFEKLVHIVDRQMDKKVDRDRLEAFISYNVSNEKNWLIRVIPLIFKSMALNIVFRLKDRAYTMTLSNIGVVQIDPEYREFIERFHLMIGVSRRQPVKCAVCSYGDEMVITFSSVFADSDLQKRFFRHLKNDGAQVRLEGNELSVARKHDMYPRIKKVLVLRKGGEAKASRMVKHVGQTSGTAARGAADYLTGKRNLRAELQRRFHV